MQMLINHSPLRPRASISGPILSLRSYMTEVIMKSRLMMCPDM